MPVKIIKNPSQEQLEGVRDWPIWEKEASEFPWHYDMQETCYFLEGDVVVTLEDGTTYEMGRGDLVTFERGLDCHWNIKEAVRKHYDFK